MPTNTPTSADERFALVVDALSGELDVSPPDDLSSRPMFGSTAQLRVRNKIFAMVLRDRLTVKLPRPRVDALVAAGAGVRFEMGQGRVMKEWIAFAPEAELDWVAFAREALAYVASKA